jgi:PEP-CTERM/exosortase A-associated glycosyltransferase
MHNPSPKILHILEHGRDLNSGYGFRSVHTFQAQRDRGWQPIVLTYPKRDECDKGDWKQPETIEGIRYYYRPLPRSGRLFSTLRKFRRQDVLADRIREVIGLENPDVLHAHSPVGDGVAALKAGRRTGIPVVYEMRSLWEEADVAHGVCDYGSRRFERLRALETWVCCNADAVVAISKNLKDHLEARGIAPSKISVAPNGVDFDSIKPAPPDAEYKEKWKLEGKQVVGYIGSFRSYEGLDLLVKVIARLAKIRPDLVLLLVGGGRRDVEAELKELVDKLDLRGRVIMPGWVPQERIPGVYGLLDLLAYPRKRLPLTELITPLKPLEAMAMGKALVASDVGGHRELIQPGHNGLFFSAGSEPALAEAISCLLDNPGVRDRLARQAAAWVRRERSWSETTSVYAAVYDRLATIAKDKTYSADIAVVCNTTRRGGVYRVASTLCNAWSRQGHNVCLIALHGYESFFHLEPFVRRLDAVASPATRPAARFRRKGERLLGRTLAGLAQFCPVKLSAKLLLHAGALWFSDRVRPLRAAVRKTNASVVVGFGGQANILTLLACRNLSCRLVISERNDLAYRRLNYPWKQLRAALYGRAARVTANTRAGLKMLETYVEKEKLSFLPNPILIVGAGADRPQESFVRRPCVLIVANLNWYKAHDILLQAFARLSPELSHWRLAIVGDGELEEQLTDQAAALGIATRVDWYGPVRDPFVYYRAASIFALPSRSEGMPNALMEAMSCSLPVVVSDASPGPLDLVKDGETGLVVPAENPAALATAIEALANNPLLRRRLGDAARLRVAEYDLSKVLAVWEPILWPQSEAPRSDVPAAPGAHIRVRRTSDRDSESML